MARARHLIERAVTASFTTPRGQRPISPDQMFIEVSEIQLEEGWRVCGGEVEVRVAGVVGGVHAGDQVEILGWLSRPSPQQKRGVYVTPRF
ncbi:MAG: hypothetical protein U1D30_26530 [Planctomycetota bacterium]